MLKPTSPFEHVDEIELAVRKYDFAGTIIRESEWPGKDFTLPGNVLLVLPRREFRTDGGALRRAAAFALSGILVENAHDCFA